MKECNCNEFGSTTFICDQMSGQCDCKSDLIVGTQCDSSKDGFFNFPNPEGKNIKGLSNITWCIQIINVILACNCNTDGSMNITCTEQGGKCFCQDNISGDKCDECSAEHYGFPSCQSIHYLKLAKGFLKKQILQRILNNGIIFRLWLQCWWISW